MRTEDGPGAFGNFGQFLDKNGAQFAEFVDHVLVMNNLLANIDWRAVEVKCYLDDVDGANHACAETAGLEQVDLFLAGIIGGNRLE